MPPIVEWGKYAQRQLWRAAAIDELDQLVQVHPFLGGPGCGERAGKACTPELLLSPVPERRLGCHVPFAARRRDFLPRRKKLRPCDTDAA